MTAALPPEGVTFGTFDDDDLAVELRRLDAFVKAYQAMPSDPERRRALNYLRDRFPGPTVMRQTPPGGQILRDGPAG
jgi:hypothetical protein